MAEVARPYTEEELLGEAVSKKDLVTFLQENSSSQFLVDNKLAGAAKNVMKTKTKDQLVENYRALFETKAFKAEGDNVQSTDDKKLDTGDADSVDKLTQKAKKLDVKAGEPVKFTKRVVKMGDRVRYAKKGDDVSCFYTGRLENGKVFDSNMEEGRKGKKPLALRFKVGVGKVIRGWDEALLTMSVGEKAEITIQPEWAYGKKGLEGKIPPNAVLIFDIELVSVE